MNITDDNVALETPEVFTLELIPPQNPLLQTSINFTRIVIIDNDGKKMVAIISSGSISCNLSCLVVVVGFNPTVYNISEGAGVVTLRVERRGATAQHFTVTLSVITSLTISRMLICMAPLRYIPYFMIIVIPSASMSQDLRNKVP